MALFTDGPPAGIEDLSMQDSQLLMVASAEGIDVTQKLALAHEELAMELRETLGRMVWTGPFFWTAEEQQQLTRVVVTYPLKLWHACKALEMVYADAYNSQLNDRYAAKRDQFGKMAARAYGKLIGAGVGITPKPIPRAQSPVLEPAAGALPDGTYYVTASWVNEAGEEGACAVETSISTVSGTFRASMPQVPALLEGWNLYAGGDPGAMTLQNAAPIAPGAAWLQADTISSSGRKPGRGQEPAFLQPCPRMIQRG